jgi:hypothetical protein
MNKFIAILGLAFIPALSPLTGHAQRRKGGAATEKSVSALHRSHFSIDKLSTREERHRTYVDGEITSNAKKEAAYVFIVVRWFDKNGKVVAKNDTSVYDLAPGETLPFSVYTDKNPEIVRYDVTIDKAYER